MRTVRRTLAATARWGSAAALVALVASGCVVAPAGTQLLPPERTARTVSATAWVAPVEVTDPDALWQAGAIRDALCLNIADFAKAAGYFSTVRTFPGKPAPEDYVLRFTFDRYVQKREPHPLYFPAAFLTATLYIWLGGPIVNETIDLSGTLAITDANGLELARANAAFAETSWKGLYSDGSMTADTSRERTAFIKQLLDRAVDGLARKGGQS